MSKSVSIANRVPISLRLPTAVMTEIESYAAKTGMRKTDAFLHFLQLGIESERCRRDNDRLKAIEANLGEILTLVRGAKAPATSDVAAIVRESVSIAAEQFAAIEQVYLFGSIARGTADEDSDVDLRLVLDRSKKFNLHDLEHFCKEVERRTGRQVDAVTSRIIKNKELASAIERDKVLIYEREEH